MRSWAARVLSLLGCVLVVFTASVAVEARMHASEMRYLRDKARDMFYHGYQSYMEHAFPWDELKPLSCEGRRWDRRERGDLDDVLGGYALTLIDSLDMLAVLGDRDEFHRAVRLVIDNVSFDRDVTVSVFESTIRVIGGLISAHLIASPAHLGVLTADEYKGELLDLAVDMGNRLLPAFETPTQLPVHRVNLKRGMLKHAPAMTCPAAAGSLLVEFAYLSRLSGNPVFEEKAKRAVVGLWWRRSEINLLGSSIDVFSGEWLTSHVGIGAGLDSYFEYLLKYHLLSGDKSWFDMFLASYRAVETHINHDDFHIEVDMHHGRQAVRSRRVSALQAFWPGLQVLAGDVSRAMRSHDKLFLLWNQFGAMPELVDLLSNEDGTTTSGSVISWARTSPLRPELIESTYHLYQATRDHKYLKIGRKLLEDIERVSRVDCGYAAVGNIHTLAVEDRMDSYFLSETVKYLYLLFSEDPDVIVPAMPLPPTNSTPIQVDSEVKVPEDEEDVPALTPDDSAVPTCACRKNTTNQTLVESSLISTKPQWSRPLKTADVVFTTEGHVLMMDTALFTRNGSDSSSKQEVFACENGNALVTQQRRQLPTPTSTESLTSVLPIGVSVRLEDMHVLTLVGAPASFGKLLGRDGTHVDAPLLLSTEKVGDACSPLLDETGEMVRGRVVMVARGGCAFAEKALHVQAAGGRGVIIVNRHRKKPKKTDRRYVITDDKRGLGGHVTIPLLMISAEDASLLKRQVSAMRAAAEAAEGDDGQCLTEGTSLVVSLSAWLH
ncbi:hypothetical protein Poli38472_004542 [Pythium oligandrum]|uniref:alpha-1,2-Mannosidase n=1 Tax=Pythium oligandrum TaxID=41045 RepID=A0A8K1FI81_PYTOL|nr:hypothetical protein Poli38472_004542 [Pythium oligandrum]|eukprot:TMW59473.1 hypothetical protein Poli38472_004542 [Pythium oligandrum]